MPHGLGAEIGAYGDFTPNGGGTPAEGLTVASALVDVFVNLETDSASAVNVTAAFSLIAQDGVTVVATGSATKVALTPGSVTTVRTVLSAVANAEAWSVPRPYLYTLNVVVTAEGASAPADAYNATVGVRRMLWDASEGFFLNDQPVKHRGFCDHESFASVGMAVPDRINLFRFQSMRGLGGNARRTSHNPPAPNMLDITDRLGIIVLDENRVFAIGDEQVRVRCCLPVLADAPLRLVCPSAATSCLHMLADALLRLHLPNQ